MDGPIRQSVLEAKVGRLVRAGRLDGASAWSSLVSAAREGRASRDEVLAVAGALGRAQEGEIWTPKGS